MKTSISAVILLMVLIFLKGCSEPACGCVQIDTLVSINFEDQQGRNLVNPDHPQAMTEQNTDLFYVIDGQNTSLAYLRFEDSTMDTLKVQYKKGDNLEVVEKVWYNHELRWNRTIADGPRSFTVIRHVEGK